MSNAQSMQVFSKLSKIEQALENSPKYKLGGGNKHVVDIDEILDLLGDLKATIPEDIKKAGGIISEEKRILSDANEQAEEILRKATEEAEGLCDQAQNKAKELKQQSEEAAKNVYQKAVEDYNALVSEQSVYKEAVRRAEILESEAMDNANTIIMGARRYADDQLAEVQRYLQNCVRTLNTNREELNVEPLPDNEPALTVKQREEKLEMKRPEPVQPEPAKRPAKPVPVYEETETEDEEEPIDEEPLKGQKQRVVFDDEADVRKTKKKNWLRRLIDGDDGEEEDEEDIPEEDEPRQKPQKKRRKLFEIVDAAEEEDDEYDEDEENEDEE